MQEIGNASKKDSTAAQNFGF